MSNRDLLSMGIRNLIKRKLRTFLTVLGVMIGTASIVVMISLGLAVNQQFEDSIASMGDMTTVQVYAYSGRYVSVDAMGNETAGETKAPDLTDESIEIIEQIPGVVVATPMMRGTLFFKSGEYTMQAYNVTGLKPRAMEALGYNVQEGRLLEEDSSEYEIVFGAYAETNFNKGTRYEDRFWTVRSTGVYEPYVDVMHDRIMMSPDYNYIYSEDDPSIDLDPDDLNAPKPIRPYDVSVVGVLEASGDFDYDETMMYMDIEQLKELAEEEERARQSNNASFGHFSARSNANEITYTEAVVKCEDMETTESVAEALRAMGYEAYFQADWINQQQEQAGMLQILLAAIGGVSMFVAAIGIANTMVMAIYERTREIGVMKVIGASIRDIKWLFLLESAMIGLIGGITGVALSYLASYALNNMNIPLLQQFLPFGTGTGNISLITPWLCGLALGCASLIGLVSGYFPARRATKLSALSAIRTE